ncbi:MAG: NADH-quinone oxidoreductase subunit M [Verrucomicrobiota bacterium]|jgi:NADH-quinone oxidoreductase subunit M|nr:NADH-quinone oxidoreductase subunit M [Verrucomicrobiota bacterium]
MITALTLAPVLAVLVILALPEGRARAVALGGALVSLALTVCMLLRFKVGEGLQFVEARTWIPELGVDYFVGLDGTNALVLLLAALLAPLAVLASWKHTDRPRTYFALLCLQFTGLFGTFTALNFFHWFLYWELALVPAFFLIKLFGNGKDRHRAALNFFLFTVIGSVAMLIGFLLLHSNMPEDMKTFNFVSFSETGMSLASLAGDPNGPFSKIQEATMAIIFCTIVTGLWVKVPLAPLHIWQAPAYAAAPTPVAMLLTGVMSKMGVYGFLRLVLPIFPTQLQQHATILMALALITILWGAFLALRQTDIKRVLAFSSLNHVAYCVLGVGALGIAANGLKVDAHALAMQGVILQMFAHGIAAAGLFYLVGLLETRTGSCGLADFGGLSAVTPRFAAAFFLLAFCSLGLPFMAGFAAEFLIFSGSFAVAPGVTVVATVGLLATAVFLLTMLQKIFTGPSPKHHKAMADLTWCETLIVIPLLILVFWAGISPSTWLLFSSFQN